MSTIQEQMVSLLNSVSPNGVFPLVANFDATYPYVVYQRIASKVENTLTGNGTPPINQTRMQVDSWAQDYQSAVTLSEAVVAAMQGWSVQNTLQMQEDTYDAEAKAYRVMCDFSIWSPAGT